MKRSILIFFSTMALISSSFTQRIDSIKYEYGFLYYHDYGKGKPIVLLSGGPGNDCIQLARMASMLAKNYRIILLEQRGTGKSIPEPFDSTTVNVSTAISDINILINKLNEKQVIICGHSWGASLAMYFASEYPDKVKSLILIGPGPYSLGDQIKEAFLNNRNVRWSLQEKKLIDSLTIKSSENKITNDELNKLKHTFRLAYISNKQMIDSLFNTIDAPSNIKGGSLLDNDASRSKVDFKYSLKKLNTPVFIICGRQDFLSYVSYELKISYNEFKLFWIENCGHFPMYERPKEFYEIFNTIMEAKKL